MANTVRKKLAKAPETVFIPDALDPEVGQVVKGVPLNDDPEEGDGGPAVRRRKPLAPISSAGGVVLVYRRVDGQYYRAGKFTGRPTDEDVLRQYPQGGAFKYEQRDRSGGIAGREYIEIPGYDAQPSDGGPEAFGWAGARPAQPAITAPQLAPPAAPGLPAPYVIHAPPAAPPTDWLKVLSVAGPLALQALQTFSSSLRSGIAEAVRAALPAPVAALPPPADPMAQLTGLASALKSLEGAGIVTLGAAGENPAEGWGGFAQMISSILEARGSSALGLAQAAATPPNPPAPAKPLTGPVPATEEAARVELQQVAQGLGTTLENVRAFLLGSYLQRSDATWRELAEAGRAYAAERQANAS